VATPSVMESSAKLPMSLMRMRRVVEDELDMGRGSHKVRRVQTIF
jgi:hypothetical protein